MTPQNPTQSNQNQADVQPAPAVPSASGYKNEDDAVKSLKTLEHSVQVRKLCNLAFEKGIDFAIGTAKRLDNPYVLDELHDALTEELNKKLIEQGKLEKL